MRVVSPEKQGWRAVGGSLKPSWGRGDCGNRSVAGSCPPPFLCASSLTQEMLGRSPSVGVCQAGRGSFLEAREHTWRAKEPVSSSAGSAGPSQGVRRGGWARPGRRNGQEPGCPFPGGPKEGTRLPCRPAPKPLGSQPCAPEPVPFMNYPTAEVSWNSRQAATAGEARSRDRHFSWTAGRGVVPEPQRVCRRSLILGQRWCCSAEHVDRLASWDWWGSGFLLAPRGPRTFLLLGLPRPGQPPPHSLAPLPAGLCCPPQWPPTFQPHSGAPLSPDQHLSSPCSALCPARLVCVSLGHRRGMESRAHPSCVPRDSLPPEAPEPAHSRTPFCTPLSPLVCLVGMTRN